VLDVIRQLCTDFIHELVNFLEILAEFRLGGGGHVGRCLWQDDGRHGLRPEQTVHLLFDELFRFLAELEFVLSSSEALEAGFNLLTFRVVTLEQQLVNHDAFGRLLVCVCFILEKGLKHFIVHVAVDREHQG